MEDDNENSPFSYSLHILHGSRTDCYDMKYFHVYLEA